MFSLTPPIWPPEQSYDSKRIGFNTDVMFGHIVLAFLYNSSLEDIWIVVKGAVEHIAAWLIVIFNKPEFHRQILALQDLRI